MTILEACGVTKTYRRGGFFSRAEMIQVLHGVDLSIDAGECVGLVGRSGSGKSTLGRLLLGLESPSSGVVRIFGKPSTDGTGRLVVDRRQRQGVQVVFQDAISSVNPRLTAADIIAEPIRNFTELRGAPLAARVAELLEQVGLRPEDGYKHPNRFSGGQLQRISIARALAAEPKCIVLDEAVSSLDMLVQAKILDLLTELRLRDGIAYLFVTHDLRLVERFCDRAVALEQGCLLEFDHINFRTASLPGSLGELAAAMLPAMPM